MKTLTQYINEVVKPENGKEWEVYFNGTLDNTFTENAKKWKKYPKVGQGWYAGGTVFKIVKIENNKVYTEEDNSVHPIISEKLIENIYKHISIELYDEYGYTFYNNAHVFERLGSFDNSGKIVMFIFENIIDKINENDLNFKINCKELNTFFENIIINIHYSNTIEGDYYNRENNNIFMNLIIPENLDSSKDWKPIMKIILHELLHAYEDYNRKDSIFNYLSNEYSKSFRFMKTSFIETNKKLFEFGYFYNDKERNAYFSNIYNDIKDVLEKLNMLKLENFNYQKFLEELKNIDVWKTYFDIAKFIINIDNLSII